jgi:hypothetical protein
MKRPAKGVASSVANFIAFRIVRRLLKKSAQGSFFLLGADAKMSEVETRRIQGRLDLGPAQGRLDRRVRFAADRKGLATVCTAPFRKASR